MIQYDQDLKDTKVELVAHIEFNEKEQVDKVRELAEIRKEIAFLKYSRGDVPLPKASVENDGEPDIEAGTYKDMIPT